jgi:hypothetical protein
MADQYIALGEYAKAGTILDEMANKAVEYINWYLSMDDYHFGLSYESCYRNFLILDEINKSFTKMASLKKKEAEGETDALTDASLHYAKKFEELYMLFNQRIGN